MLKTLTHSMKYESAAYSKILLLPNVSVQFIKLKKNKERGAKNNNYNTNIYIYNAVCLYCPNKKLPTLCCLQGLTEEFSKKK